MIVSRLYRLLLVLYPQHFRDKYGEEQAAVFDKMWEETLRDRNIFSVGWFALSAFVDLLVTSLLIMDEKPGIGQRISSFLALLLLMPSTIFATINITKYNLGIPVFYDSWISTGIHFSDVVILASPLLAMTVLILPLVQVDMWSGNVLQRSNQKFSRSSIIIAGGSIMVMAIFMVYGIAENVISTL